MAPKKITATPKKARATPKKAAATPKKAAATPKKAPAAGEPTPLEARILYSMIRNIKSKPEYDYAGIAKDMDWANAGVAQVCLSCPFLPFSIPLFLCPTQTLHTDHPPSGQENGYTKRPRRRFQWHV